jgi:hypothetical protein
MPILAPDRNKGKIASLIVQRLAPSRDEMYRQGVSKNLGDIAKSEDEAEETIDISAAETAMRAMYGYMCDGDFKGALRAYKAMHQIVDAVLEKEEGEDVE